MGNEKKYQQEVLEWELEQICMREKYAGTPPGFDTPEAAAEARHKLEEDRQRLVRAKRRDLLSGYRPTKEFFAGRRTELAAIADALKAESGPVVLYGVGGIGKSALARAFARENVAMYEHILMLHFSESIQDMIVDDFELKISNLYYDDKLYDGRRAYFREKYKIFQQILRSKKVLLIVDNCNFRKDKDMQKLFALPCDLLLTTRIDPNVWKAYGCRCCGICVEQLKNEEEWDDFIKGYQKEPATSEQLEKWRVYRDRIQGHTLLMQLKVCNPGLKLELERAVWENLLGQFTLKKTEENVLMYLSALPQKGIPCKLFYRFTNASQSAVRHLTEYMLIGQCWNENWQDEVIFMRPVIAAAVREIYRPNCRNCNHLITGLGDYLSDRTGGGCTWVRTYEENQSLEPYVLAVMRTFPRPEAHLAEAFDEIVSFLWIQGYFKEAEAYALKLYEAVRESYGEIHQMTGYIACRTAAVYYNCMDFEKALLWGQMAYRTLQTCTPVDSKYDLYCAHACERLAKLYWHDERRDEALWMVEQLFYYLERQKTVHNDMLYAYAVLLKSKFLFQMGDIAQASALFESEIVRLQNIEELWSRAADAGMEFRSNEFRSFYVSLLAAQNQLEKAYETAKLVVEKAVRYRGDCFKDSLSGMEQLGDICAALGKKNEACGWYGNIVACIEENYPYQTQWKNRILDKMGQVV